MALTRENYRSRLVDKKIERYLRIFGAVAIEGPRWCGKTWTVLNHANSVTYLMDKSSKALAELDPSSALVGAAPHAIDEWQEIPAIWDTVRHEVDKRTEKGRFLLTGSVTQPEVGVLHSGTGRISRIRMHSMTLFEAGKSTGEISLSAILAGDDIKPKLSKSRPIDLATLACVGGWPGNMGLETEDALEMPKEYLRSMLDLKTSSGKNRIRNAQNFRFLLASLARNSASLVKNATLHNEVQSASGEFSGDALAAYLNIPREQFVLEEIPGWSPQLRSKARMLTGPKRFFTDPSLAAAAQGASPELYLNDWQAFGGVFEGLCLRDLQVYAELAGANLYHYHDNSDLEADAIMEFQDGSWAAFEIKLGEKEIAKGAKSLISLKEKLQKSGHMPPKCLAVVCGSGLAQKREDGVYTIPIEMLRD
jgi:predicted AAA+ superfamily ATPase